MKLSIHILCSVLLACCAGVTTMAQPKPDSTQRKLFEQHMLMLQSAAKKAQTAKDSIKRPDSGMVKQLKQKVTDSVKSIAKGKVNQLDADVKVAVNNLNAQKNAVVNDMRQKASATIDHLKKLQDTTPEIKVALDNRLRYQPASSGGLRIVNNIGGRVDMQLLGMPFTFNFAQNHGIYQGTQPFNNGLFKFGYNTNRLTDILKKQVQQYANYKDRFFSGMELSDYMREMIFHQAFSPTVKGKSNYTAFQALLNDPAKLTHLLQLDQQQLRTQLTDVLNQSLPDSVKRRALEYKKLQSSAKNGAGNSQLRQQLINRLSQSLPDSTRLRVQEVAKLQAAIDAKGGNASQRERLLMDSINRFLPDTVKDNLKLIEGQHGDAKAILNAQLKNQIGTKADTLQHVANIANQARNIKDARAFEQMMANEAKADSLTQAITAMKMKMAQYGLTVDRVMMMEKYLSGDKVSAGSVREMLSTDPNNKVQSLFTHFNDLRAGDYSLTVPGALQNEQIFIKGSHLNFNLGYTPFSVGYGNLNDLNSLKDANYQTSIYSFPKNISYISTKLGGGALGKLNLSIVSAFGNQFPGVRFSTPTLPSNSVAFTLSKSMNLGNAGNFMFDVSRSTTLFANKYEPGAEVLLDKKAGGNFSINNDLFQALSFGFNHFTTIQSLGMSDNVYFSYSGLGYQNPANSGYTGGKMKYGGNIKKSFYHNKYTISVRADMRDMPLSYVNSDKWKNYQIQLDNRFKLTDHINLNLKYMADGTGKTVEGIRSTVYQSQKIEADANTSFKIGKYYLVGHLGVGKQNINNMYLAQTSSSLLMVNYAESMVMRNATLTGTFFYNKELSSVQLIGNMINSDLTYQFPIAKILNFSTGVTYMDNAGIAQQLGIRQGLQVMAVKQFTLSSYLDIRRNLITPLYPDLYSACRGEIDLKYSFNLR